MTTNNDKNLLISELIFKLTMSGLPPFAQEIVLNRLAQIPPETMHEICQILDTLDDKKGGYLGVIDRQKEFYAKLKKNLQEKQLSEADKMIAEIEQGLSH